MFEHVDLLFEFVLVPLFLKGPRISVPDVLCDLEELTKIVCEEYGGLGGIPANAVCKQNASGPYIRYLDIALGGSPFVNAAAGDFRLNNTYGNFIKGRAPPLSWPGLSNNRPYQDMGPIQHQDAGFAG